MLSLHGECFLPLRQVVADEPWLVLRGDGGLERDAAPVCRMIECQSPGVQHQTAGFGFLPLRVGVNGVSHQGMSQMQHVDSYLVGASGMQRAHDQR